MLRAIKTSFTEAKINFMEMDAKHRPFLPKRKPNKKLYQIASILNKEILPREITPDASYNDITGLMYCTAYTLTQYTQPPKQSSNINEGNQRCRRKQRGTIPAWQRRLQGKIEDIRRDLGFLTGYNTNKPGKKTEIKLRNIKRRHIVHTQFDPLNQTIQQLRDTVRQKLDKYTQSLRSYTKSRSRVRHNNMFQTEESHFYNMITKKKPDNEIAGNNNIDINEIENYWKEIWGKPVTHNPAPVWIDTIRDIMVPITPMATTLISQNIFKKAIRKLHNWKQPGSDKIHNFYYKYFTIFHDPIINIYNRLLANPDHIPQEMCTGVTYLKAKVDKPISASQFRPITCLNSGYKIFTSCIAIKISDFCEANNIIAEEQKGCRKGTKGCKDQLIIDSVATKQAIRNRRNLYTAFIDYRKAFDSVPHSWLLEVLNIYKIDPVLINCIEGLMRFWETTMHLRQETNDIISNPIKILRGIYQGDSLSPLIFCLALNPLSHLLQRSQYGYKLDIGTDVISHCLYMDDLKLYANTNTKRDYLLKIVELFSQDIKMQFGIDKCRTQNIVRGNYASAESFRTEEGEEITPLHREEHYKYLGIHQHITIDHKKQKEEITKEFKNRVTSICGSKLNGRNIVKAINTFAIPLLIYTFGIISWSSTDLDNLDMKIRTIMTKHKHHHPRASVERMNIPRRLGGRGILNIRILHDTQIKKLVKYFKTKATTSALYRGVINADDNLTPLNLKNDIQSHATTIDNLIQNWKSKPLHGKYPNAIKQSYVDEERTNNWLKYSNIFSETEGFVIAIQDGVIHTKNYRKYIMRDNNIAEDSCRRCGSAPETTQHLLNNCPTMLNSHYKQRHDNIGKIVHINIIKNLVINEPTTYFYKYQPKPIIENQNYIIYWDRSILIDTPTGISIPNRPDMIVIHKQHRKAQIIDFAVPLDNNIQETIATKKTKYLQLAQYLKSSKNLLNVEILPIVISSLGTIPTETTSAIKRLNLNVNILTEMQKSILIRATTIMRETLE